MRRSILTTSAALFAALALPAAAQERPTGQPTETPPTAPQGTNRPPPADTEEPLRPPPPGPGSPYAEGTPYAMPASGGPENPSGGAPAAAQKGGQGVARMGEFGPWDPSWGPEPPPPPPGWENRWDWHRHVRACQTRYRTYNPYTDIFVPRIGMLARCRL